MPCLTQPHQPLLPQALQLATTWSFGSTAIHRNGGMLARNPKIEQDNDSESSQPRTPHNRKVPVDAFLPHRLRPDPAKRLSKIPSLDDVESQESSLEGGLKRYDTISSLDGMESQESSLGGRPSKLRHMRPLRRVPRGSLQSDDLGRLSESDLPIRNLMKTPRHKRNAHIAKDSPLAWSRTANKRSLHPNKAEDVHLRNADEGMKVLIGPMPVDEFLDEFLPAVDESDMPDPTGAFDSVSTTATRESDIYPELISAVNDNGRCPGLTFVNTSVTSGQRRRGFWKQDISIYNEGDVPLLRKTASKKYPGVFHTSANLGLAESFWEVKPNGCDPFCDDHGDEKHFFEWENYTKDSDVGKQKKKALGQAVSYAGEACARQHRIFYISILIIGTKARLFRWDRAGTIVTRAFDYRQNPRPLCQYLWRFSHADMVERGFDSTVTVAIESEIRLFESTVAQQVAFQKEYGPDDREELAEAIGNHYQENRVTKITVRDSSGSVAGEYLVSVPVRSPLSTSGRSGRGFWSTKIEEKEGNLEGEAGFLKDVWRIDLPGLMPEGSILTDMAGKVPNIPEVDCSGDCTDDIYDYSEDLSGSGGPVIEDPGTAQATKTQEFIDKDWVSKSCRVLPRQKEDNLYRRIVRHVHYRMVSKTVGFPLSDFTDARELFLALQDVLEAIIAAYEKCQRLHRDVSLDNIILYRSKKGERRRGVLIDWEFSVPVSREGKARDYHRSGTWAFMSTFVLQREPDFCHLLQDDLESIFYVSIYCSVLWLPHDEVEGLGKWTFEFFDEFSVRSNILIGGFHKVTYKSNFRLFSREFVFVNRYINWWFLHAYQDLSTYLNPDQKDNSKWTKENLRTHLRALCEGVRSIGQQGLERVEHSVEDQAIPDIPDQAIAWATHISTSNTPGASRFSEISQHGPDRGHKRSRSIYEEVATALTTQNKRSRVSMHETGGERPPSHDEPDDDDVEVVEEDDEKQNYNKLLDRVDGIIKEVFPQQSPDEDNGQLVSYSDN